MVLLTFGGWAAQEWLGVAGGTVLGLLAGLLLARLVPSRSSCAVSLPERREPV